MDFTLRLCYKKVGHTILVYRIVREYSIMYILEEHRYWSGECGWNLQHIQCTQSIFSQHREHCMSCLHWSVKYTTNHSSVMYGRMKDTVVATTLSTLEPSNTQNVPYQ